MFTDNITLTGSLKIKKYNENNILIEEFDVKNLVVTVGKQHVAQRIAGYTGSSSTVMNYMAIGTTNSAPASDQTALAAAKGPRVVLDSVTTSGAVVTFAATFGPGTDYEGTIVEAGVFNALTSGTMLCRTTFAPITKSATETIAIIWNVSVG